MIHSPRNPNGRQMRDRSIITTTIIRKEHSTMTDDDLADEASQATAIQTKDQTIQELRAAIAQLEDRAAEWERESDNQRDRAEDAEAALAEIEDGFLVRTTDDIVGAFEELSLFERGDCWARLLEVVARKGLPR